MTDVYALRFFVFKRMYCCITFIIWKIIRLPILAFVLVLINLMIDNDVILCFFCLANPGGK